VTHKNTHVTITQKIKNQKNQIVDYADHLYVFKTYLNIKQYHGQHFFWTKKGNGLKLDENRLDEYRSWTKTDWTKTGLDENRIGRKKLDENRLDENRLDENW